METATHSERRKILVTGSHGLVGTAVCDHLRAAGHEVIGLPRGNGNDGTWCPETGVVDEKVLKGCDAFIHLAGESIAGLWTEAKKARIRNSRLGPTRRLAMTLAGMTERPAVFVCASASGFYGNRGDEILTEKSSRGEGYLAEICEEWEEATGAASQSGIRVVNARFSIILSKEGGALKTMLIPFRLGLGGTVGDGRQWWSWITLHDVARGIEHALSCEKLAGPVNYAAPNAVANREFTRKLGRVIKRPTGFPLPAFAARLALGEAADEMLLTSIRMAPEKLERTGFEFEHPKLREALRLTIDD